jgi:hypothetical protein
MPLPDLFDAPALALPTRSHESGADLLLKLAQEVSTTPMMQRESRGMRLPHGRCFEDVPMNSATNEGARTVGDQAQPLHPRASAARKFLTAVRNWATVIGYVMVQHLRDRGRAGRAAIQFMLAEPLILVALRTSPLACRRALSPRSLMTLIVCVRPSQQMGGR